MIPLMTLLNLLELSAIMVICYCYYVPDFFATKDDPAHQKWWRLDGSDFLIFMPLCNLIPWVRIVLTNSLSNKQNMVELIGYYYENIRL